MALTDRKIATAAVPAKIVRLHDARGLYVELHPNGGKYWRYRFSIDGLERRLSLGTYPDVSLREARLRRDAMRARLAQGVDPSVERRESKRRRAAESAGTFAAVAREWASKQRWTAKHADDVRRRLEANLFPDLGALPIGAITAPVLLACLRRVEHRGAHDLAHRLLGVAGQVFRYGVAAGYCETDPSGALRGALTTHKARHQSAIRPEELPALLRAIDRYHEIGDRQTGLALRLLCLTFARTSELINATWDEFRDLDGEAPTWEIPAERMKMRQAHVVPLAPQAVAILDELRAIGGGSRYVLPGRNPDKPISNNTLLFALYRLGYKSKMTAHGFRAVASTALNEAGFRADVIEAQLAHAERDEVRAAYNRALYMPERRTMLRQWADMVDAYARGGDVVPIKRRA